MGSIWTGSAQQVNKCPAVAVYPISPTGKYLSNVHTATGWLEDFFYENNDFDK